MNAFARQFGGGGHAKAAGALIPGSLEEVRDQVVARPERAQFLGESGDRDSAPVPSVASGPAPS